MQNSTMIAKYAADLHNHIKQTTAECKATESKAVVCKAQAWRDRLTPLEVRLEKILAEIPSEVQAEGLSLHTLQQFVTGRWRGNAHPGELGAALRHLGWHRTRQWRGDETGFRALWFPASTKKEQQP
jgi:hypothetical protein